MHLTGATLAAILVSYLGNVIATKQGDMLQPEIIFTGHQYLKYIPSRSIYEKTDSNKLVFRFRTVHPSGLLFLLTGKQKMRSDGHDSVMSVQLIQGYFSYSLSEYGKRPSEILIFGNFNDDQWHDVMIIRTSAISEIRVDNHTKTLVSPPSYSASSFQDYVYVGGYDYLKVPSKSDSMLPLFTGCLQLLELNNRDPIKYFLQGSQRIEIRPFGQQISTGRCGKTKYQPVEFTKFYSTLTFPYPDESTMDSTSELFIITFSIRTFSSSGLIFESVESELKNFETEISKGMKLEISNKIIQFKIWYLKRKWEVSLQSDVIISDGLWHVIEVQVSINEIRFQINNNVKRISINIPFSLKKIQKGLRFGANTVNGKRSFIGCLNHIQIQHVTYADVIENENIIKNNVKEGCGLMDHCFPNPCLNGGKCQQERNQGICDCSATEFYGKFCEKPLYKTSCAAYQKLGLNETSYCLIDLDGSGALLPHTNLCEFPETNDGKEIATVVHHNKEYEFSPLEGDETLHSYTFHRFNYELDDKSIKSLIKSSRHCRQRVLFRCYNTALFNAPHGPSNVMWKTGSGQTKGYWGNVPSNSTGCECGVKKNCIVGTKQCNCDAMLNSWNEDTGYITEKADLPLKRLQVTGMKSDRSIFSIGPLECFGLLNEDEVTKDLKTYTNEKFLSKACVSISKKKRLITIANMSASSKLYREKPLMITVAPSLNPTGDTYGSRYFRTSAPLLLKQNENLPNGLSIVEIVFIVIAALATIILLVKFVFCSLFHKLHGQITLNHEQRFEDPGTFIAADTLTISSSYKKQNVSSDMACNNKGCVKVPNNYWV